MARVITLDPAVTTGLKDNWQLVATQASRLAGGIKATIVLANGEMQHSDAVMVSDSNQRRTFAEAVLERAHIPVTETESALLKLHEGIEGCLRQCKPLPQTVDPDQPQRPHIVVTRRWLRDIATDALAALHASNQPPTLYQRGTAWVRVQRGQAHAEVLTATSLKGILDRAANFVKLEQNRETPARPPADLAPDLLTLPDPGLPNLEGISTVPVVLPDGRILTTSGYDPDSGLLLVLGEIEDVHGGLPPSTAIELLVGEMLGDFPFVDEAGIAHTLALILERFVRPLIKGPCPLYLIDAPTQGTGKGLLAEVASLVVMGIPAPVMALGRDEDEVDKRITAMLLAGNPVVLLDNVTALYSTTLAAVLTAETWRGRRLGKSQMIEVPNDATWIATGNNVELSHELARRAVPIRLDAGMERPEERAGFRHPNLPGWVQANRKDLVSACLSLIRAWLNAGRPAGTATLGRYESWAEVLGGILGVSGVSGLLSGRERLHAEANRETREWEAMCASWWETYGEHPVTAGALFADVIKPNNLLLGLWGGRSHIAAVQRLGHALGRNRDRTFGQWVIRPAGRDSQTKNVAYRLEKKSGEKTPETPETTVENTQVIDNRSVIAKKNTGVLNCEPAKHPQNTPFVSDCKKSDCEEEMGVSGVSGVLCDRYSPDVEGEL